MSNQGNSNHHGQRRVATVRWGSAIVLAIVLFMLRAPLADAWWRSRFVALPDSARVARLADGTEVRLADGAQLAVHAGFGESTGAGKRGTRWVRLSGTARLTVRQAGRLRVLTPAGVLAAGAGEFEVRAGAETTYVVAGPPSSGRAVRAEEGAIVWLSVGSSESGAVRLFSGDTGRMLRDGRVVYAPARPDTVVVSESVTPALAPPPARPEPAAPRAVSLSLVREAAEFEPEITVVDPERPPPGLGEVRRLGLGVRLRLDPRATLESVPSRPHVPGQVYRLSGVAHLLVPYDTSSGMRGTAPTWIETRAGFVAAAAPAALRVHAHGDTTDVELFTIAARPRMSPTPGPWSGSSAALMYETDASGRPAGDPVFLAPGQRGRLVRGAVPERLP